MSSPFWLLPSEVWAQVFESLCPEDGLRVRAVCTDFRDLVDSSGLWTDWTVTLRRTKSEYNEEFWNTLRRWRVSSVAVACPLRRSDIFTELPGLTTLILDYPCSALESLECFSNLERLHLKRAGHMTFDSLFRLLPPQLVHLSVCEFIFRKWWLRDPNPLSFDTATHLTNLTSLVCHCSFSRTVDRVLEVILSAFPQLTHLSVLGPSDYGLSVHHYRDEPSLQHRSLSSLEIVEIFHPLRPNVMKMVPCLRSLALFFEKDHSESEPLRISPLLEDLPALTSLLVSRGPNVREFVGSIPSLVTHLTLCHTQIGPAEMTALSSQLPNLLHLHLEWYPPVSTHTALLPQLCPGLRSLRIRLEQLPEEAFLSLATLRDLELLEIQSPAPPPEELIRKLRELTKNRVRVCHRSDLDHVRTCCSMSQPTSEWTLP